MSALEPEGRETVVEVTPDAPDVSESVELEPAPAILNPISGELVVLSDLGGVAVALQQIREAKRKLDGYVAAFSDAAIEESRHLGKRTMTVGRLQVVVSGDTELEWDIGRLQQGLAEAGCPEERINELVKAEVTYSVDGTVSRQLSAANPAYKTAIEAAKSRVPIRQYVSVKDL